MGSAKVLKKRSYNMGRRAKNDDGQKQYKEFQKLDEEWRSEWLGKTTPELYKKIADVAIDDINLAAAKEQDEDLKRLQEQTKGASEIYSEGKKTNRIRIKFIKACLQERGEKMSDIADFVRHAANSESV
jgi:hypothetical protein